MALGSLKTRPIQTNFSGGEIDPLLFGRTDSSDYSSAVCEMTNYNADRRGPAVKRYGYEYKNSFTAAESKAFQFKLSRQPPFVVVLTEVSVFIYDSNGVLSTSFTSPWTAAQVSEIQAETSPDTDEIYFVQRQVTPYKLVLTAGVFTFLAVSFTFGVNGAPWATSFPGSLAFFQGCLWLGGTDALPTYIWRSRPSLYSNFDFGTIPILSNYAIEFKIQKHGDTSWMIGYKSLFIGLDTAETSIASQGNVISFNDSQLLTESANGSAPIQPNLIKNMMSYVSSDKRTLYSMRFNLGVNGNESKELNLEARHLTSGLIKESHYRSFSVPSLILVLENGEVVQGNLKPNERYGWSRHTTQGIVKSATVTNEGLQSSLWILVQRDGTNVTHLEKQLVGSFLDSNLTVTLANESQSFSGFMHLAGKTVRVLTQRANDPVGSPMALHPDVVVSPTGVVNTAYPALKVSVGLKYSSKLVTLAQTTGDKNDSVDNNTKHFSEIYVKLKNSAIPLINGHRASVRNPSSPMGLREPNLTGTVSVNTLGWDKEALITVEQDLPFDSVITNIGGELWDSKL